ncbi:MAG: hypothetical protein LBI66_07380 [Burkholderiaceae bacterium]|jgi:hypothetical protein|nr:hypothetical protein [Burkholderiaceae bacterium]
MAKRQFRHVFFVEMTKINTKTAQPFANEFAKMATPMFAARPFLLLNIAPAALAGVAVRAIASTTITTIKG